MSEAENLKDCHSEPPLAGAKNLGVAARRRRPDSKMLRLAQHDSPRQVARIRWRTPKSIFLGIKTAWPATNPASS
jgi:hypothetical protein